MSSVHGYYTSIQLVYYYISILTVSSVYTTETESTWEVDSLSLDCFNFFYIAP